jgi:hypothetical protein
MISNNEPHPSSSFYFCLQQHPFNNYHPIGGSFISISLSLGHCPHYSSSLLSLVEILPQTLLRLWLEWCKKIPPCTIEFIRSQILLAIVATNSKSSFSRSLHKLLKNTYEVIFFSRTFLDLPSYYSLSKIYGRQTTPINMTNGLICQTTYETKRVMDSSPFKEIFSSREKIFANPL